VAKDTDQRYTPVNMVINLDGPGLDILEKRKNILFFPGFKIWIIWLTV
jgi:hypothetical protein